MMKFFDPTRQYQKIKDEVDAAIKNVFESGRFILGENVSTFEKNFSKYCNSKEGVGVASGTDALILALKASDIGAGDEVITVPNTAVPTVSAIVSSGAKPVFVDINPKTYTIAPELIKDAITPKTKAILPVHLYGQPADMKPILEIAEKHGLTVIEDCCQAHGAEYEKRKVPYGDIGCFSFYPTKNLGAYGDGGMVVTKNGGVAGKVRLLRNYGQEKKNYSRIHGLNSRLDEIQAAILNVKLRYLDGWNEKRRSHARTYGRILGGNAGITVPTEGERRKHVYHLYVIQCDNRDRVKQKLDACGVETQVHYPLPVHLQEAYLHLGYASGSFPLTEECAQKILSLPMYPELTKNQVTEAAEKVVEYA